MKTGAVVCRREFLRFGGGLAASSMLIHSAAAGDTAVRQDLATGQDHSGTARSCILVYLLGGPPHLDMWDMKPGAPREVRGPFRPIPTAVTGLQICEHLPRLAAQAQDYSLIRSVSHPNSNHTPMIYYTLTGYHTAVPGRDNDIRPPLRTDFPHLGSVVSHLMPSRTALPECIVIPELAIRSSTGGQYKRARLPLRGGNAGFLGARNDPLAINGDPGQPDSIPDLLLPSEVSLERLHARNEILSLMDGGRIADASSDTLRLVRKRAVTLTGAAHAAGSRPFSLDDEPATLRRRYGSHRFGRALLLARRLVERGVRMVAIHFNEMTLCDGWDTHSDNFTALESELLPLLDQGLSALLEDLKQRGLLEETLVVAMGEFGRTPKINPNAGRDHWGDCSSIWLAGGGVRGGSVLGESDKLAAYPVSDPVDPVDVHATMYHCLGLNPRQTIHDQFQRPFPISSGRVLKQLF
jgi:hypothetical protein